MKENLEKNKGSGIGVIGENRRFAPIRREKYVIAFLFTTLVFIAGILLGSEITKGGVDAFRDALRNDLLESQSLDVELSMLQLFGLKEQKCAYMESRLPDIARKKVEIGRKFDLGTVPENERRQLSSEFVLSLGKYFMFNGLMEKECGLNKPTVLFFKDDSEASRQQARVLDNIVFKLSDINITVFTFHKSFTGQAVVRLIYNAYDVTETPTIIIKNAKYTGFQSLDRLTEIICLNYDNNYTASLCKR